MRRAAPALFRAPSGGRPTSGSSRSTPCWCALFPGRRRRRRELGDGRRLGIVRCDGAPFWLSVPLSLVALDFTVWARHVLFHRAPWLWRLHRMHHADLDYDVTTALRFHPLEILLSVLVKMGAVVLLGAPAATVVVFEIVLNALAMFNHANAGLPPRIEPLVRLLLVTPDMHRVHHSVVPAETHSNFGFNLSLWDRMFRVYRAAPAAGQGGMTIGLPILRDPAELRLRPHADAAVANSRIDAASMAMAGKAQVELRRAEAPLLPAPRARCEAHGLLRCAKQRGRFVHAFAVLVGGIGIVDDAGAGLRMHLAVLDDRVRSTMQVSMSPVDEK